MKVMETFINYFQQSLFKGRKRGKIKQITYFSHWIFRKIASFFTLANNFLKIMESFFAKFDHKLKKKNNGNERTL